MGRPTFENREELVDWEFEGRFDDENKLYFGSEVDGFKRLFVKVLFVLSPWFPVFKVLEIRFVVTWVEVGVEDAVKRVGPRLEEPKEAWLLFVKLVEETGFWNKADPPVLKLLLLVFLPELVIGGTTVPEAAFARFFSVN